MKTILTTIVCAAALGAAIDPSYAADAKAGPPGSVITLADLKHQLILLQDKVSTTTEALQQVKESAKSESSLSKAATEFHRRFAALEGQFSTVRTQAVVVKARAKEHYENWQKELSSVQNTDIREKAQKRYTASREEFDKIVAKAERAKEEALPFTSQLKDIAIYLDADLSEEAVKSLSNTIWKLNGEAKSLNGSISDVVDQIDRTIKSLPKK